MRGQIGTAAASLHTSVLRFERLVIGKVVRAIRLRAKVSAHTFVKLRSEEKTYAEYYTQIRTMNDPRRHKRIPNLSSPCRLR
jgi:hypothetical protein